MKKLQICLITVLMVGLLTGCQCRHEWVSASCITPKTCGVCGDVEGKALGHTWLNADCVSPERCSVCQEMKGAPLGHTFGSWQAVGDTRMERCCEICGETETVPADGAILMAEALKGTGWIGSYESWHFISFDTTNQIVMKVNDALYSGTWEMGEEQQTERSTGYHIYITDMDTGEKIHIVMVKPKDEGTVPYMAYQSENRYVVFVEYHMPSPVGAWEYVSAEWARKNGGEVPPTVVIHDDYSADLITDTAVYKGTAEEYDESFADQHLGGFNNRAYRIQTEGYQDVYLLLSSTDWHGLNIGNTTYRYILEE